MITKEAKLYLGAPRGISPPIRISQYDTTWRWQFTVYDGDEVWTPPIGTVVLFEGRKPDGTVVTANGTINDTNVIVDCTEQISSASGTIECELRFSDDDKIVGTANFQVKVEAAPIAGYIASNDDFSAVDQLVTRALHEAERIERIGGLATEIEQLKTLVGTPLVATSSDSMTNTSKIYVYTGSETGMVNGDWYYYDGSDWADGGVYNSIAVQTDTSLSISGQAADAAAVGDLKHAFDLAEEGLQRMSISANPRPWEIGTINIASGDNVANSTNRLRYVISHDVSKYYLVKTIDGYSLIVCCYDSNGTYLGYLRNGELSKTAVDPWQKAVNICDAPNTVSKIRILLKKDDDSNVALTDYVGCLICSKEDAIDTTVTVESSYIGYKEIAGLDNFRSGAIDNTGTDRADQGYLDNSFRTAGFETVDGAEYIVSSVEQNAVTNYYHYVLFYDSSFGYISRVGGSKYTDVIAEVPSNAEYFRVSLTQITDISHGKSNVTRYVLMWAAKNDGYVSPKTKWYVLGDSISAGYYSMTQSMAEEAGVTMTYISPVTTDGGEVTGSVWDSSLSHNYWGYANKWIMMRELVGKAYPGQGYFYEASNSQNGIYVVDNNDFSDAGLITVAWGFNDWHYNQTRGDHNLIDSNMPYPTNSFDTSSITTVNQAIWWCLGTLIRKAPNAQIVVQTPMNGWAYGGDFDSNWGIGTSMSNSGTLADIHDDIVYWASYYGLQVLEMTYNNSIVNRRNIKDTIIDGSHPSDVAHQQLGRYVAGALQYR